MLFQIPSESPDETRAHDPTHIGETGDGRKLYELSKFLLMAFISYLQQTEEKIQHGGFKVRQKSEFVKYVLFVMKDREIQAPSFG